MELGNLNLNQLRALQSKVESEIKRRSSTARRDLKKRMEKMAADEGLSLEDVFGTPADSAQVASTKPVKVAKVKKLAKSAKPAKVSVIKYRNPANPDQGWTGHGRKPQWAIDWLASGKTLDELAA